MNPARFRSAALPGLSLLSLLCFAPAFTRADRAALHPTRP